MQRNLGRTELVERLLRDVSAGKGGSDLLEAFAGEILKRVDDNYLYKHRLTTLHAQLDDSLRWVSEQMSTDELGVRVFRPTAATHGYDLEGVVIETLMDDQPFIVDTMKLCLEARGVRLINSLNVLLPSVLEDNVLVNFDVEAEHKLRVSYTRWYADMNGELPADLESLIRERLNLSRVVVRDFHRMVRAVKVVANEFEYFSTLESEGGAACAEAREFLEWLPLDHFLFMGVSFYARGEDGAVTLVPERSLGSAEGRSEPSGPSTASALEFFAEAKTLEGPLLRIRKSQEEARVHRPGKVDEILVRMFDDQGRPSGGLVLHGLFTFKGLSEPGSKIPILRRKLDRLLGESDVVEGSYDHKAMINAFNTLPVEYLFEAEHDSIAALIDMNVKADARHEIRSQVVINEDASSAFAFVAVPKEHYTDEIRAAMQASLRDGLRASYVDHRVHLGKFGTVALHFYLTGTRPFSPGAVRKAELALVDIGTPWSFRLLRQLEAEAGGPDIMEAFGRWAGLFPEAYTDVTSVEQAVIDIRHLEEVIRTQQVRFDVVPRPGDTTQALIRIYSLEPLNLTSILPVVDNFGIVVLEQAAVGVPVREAPNLTVNTLYIERGEHDIIAQRVQVIDALLAVFRRHMRSDRLNRLLLVARLTWREVDLIRAYSHYSRQLGHQLDPETLQKVLITHHAFVDTLAKLFRLRFDPDLRLDNARRDLGVQTLEETARGYLERVKSFEEDRILRIFLNLCEATVRTNFYRRREDDEHFISVKLECAKVEEMPEPRPLYEIYVHHARVEGVHLRGGRVARGGIRWSDRLDDYRSEVLGLMATQMLKNTLIVPVGAKGGFILKDPVEDYAEARTRADALYRIFIRGLLELTDNRVGGKIVEPPRVRRYDGDDPYLVVAADKGTAHLSDTANGISADFDFWLGDAFASGGSVGYDHKVKGITARGAWVCTRRHFREMGIDPETDVITVVGIGDMSGDVFGNGLLSSRTLKLLAAFDHRHIFLDPDPDPAISFAERSRLFQVGRSSWRDYDAALISTGGGVFDRGDKSIQLSEEVRELLDTELTSASGEAIMRLILRAEVDLLWNGGIGTYFKASGETHQDVEDKANDRVRVDAGELRCRVVGEGGNLGATMRGRVEYAARGGRINLDAIDNSGGVDLSDHEVNIKILLQPEVASGALDPETRNALLQDIGDLVCDAVLENSASQAQAISLDSVRSQENVWAFGNAMLFLRDRLGFSRRRENLPRGVEVLESRHSRRHGFYRPELAKLLSYSKMLVFSGLMSRPVGPADTLTPFLHRYFPPRIVDEHADAVSGHMLFHEIAATVQTNHILDHAGVTFYPSVMAATDRPVPDVTAAYLLAEELLGAVGLRAEVAALATTLSATAEYHAHLTIEEALASCARWLLDTHEGPLTLEHRAGLEPLRPVVERLGGPVRRALPAAAWTLIDEDVHRSVSLGISTELATRLAALRFQSHAPRIGKLGRATGRNPAEVAGLWFAAGYAIRVMQLLDGISKHEYREPWDAIAIAAIEHGLYDSVASLGQLLGGAEGALPSAEQVERAVARWPGLCQLREQLENALRKPVPVSAMFVFAERLERQVTEARRQSDAPTPGGPSVDHAAVDDAVGATKA